MGNKSYKKARVISNENISTGVYYISFEGEFSGKPGQFFMLRLNDKSMMIPRPFGICDLNHSSISFLYEVVGKGTKLMSNLKKGDYLEILGPLGNNYKTDIEKDKKVALVSGSCGIAPFLYYAKKLKCKLDLYAGFSDKEYFTNYFKDYVDSIYIATETGKDGYKGYVTELINENYYDYIYACGPSNLYEGIKQLNHGAKFYIATESRMGCGIGACLSCSVKTIDGMKRACKEASVILEEDLIC